MSLCFETIHIYSFCNQLILLNSEPPPHENRETSQKALGSPIMEQRWTDRGGAIRDK